MVWGKPPHGRANPNVYLVATSRRMSNGIHLLLYLHISTIGIWSCFSLAAQSWVLVALNRSMGSSSLLECLPASGQILMTSLWRPRIWRLIRVAIWPIFSGGWRSRIDSHHVVLSFSPMMGWTVKCDEVIWFDRHYVQWLSACPIHLPLYHDTFQWYSYHGHIPMTCGNILGVLEHRKPP